MKIPGEALAAITLCVGATRNAAGRIFSGWMSDTLGRLNVLRLMIGLAVVAFVCELLAKRPGVPAEGRVDVPAGAGAKA